MKEKKINWEKWITIFVFASLVISIIFIILKLTIFKVDSDPVTGTYSLMLAQCFLGCAAIIAPSYLEKHLKLEIPSHMMIPYVIFLYCAIFLGEVRSFYYNFAYWDMFLHTLSGGMLGMLGFSIVSLLNKTKAVPIDLSPGFVAIFAFCFAITIGVFWEIYEFSFDGFLGMNMQKFMLEDGTQFIGRAALTDTMQDLIVDCIGAFVATSLGYLAMKFDSKWLKNMQLKKENKHDKTL
ncbi:MAG: hypothetical protein MR210_09190 [Erysipelotrichaceae bacterium]|nr:hypothetical protein [Erysipelotrichaceae bacterium]MDY5252978.1 hypothetical protein [Erysipelotrichaceae bacterium]